MPESGAKVVWQLADDRAMGREPLTSLMVTTSICLRPRCLNLHTLHWLTSQRQIRNPTTAAHRAPAGTWLPARHPRTRVPLHERLAPRRFRTTPSAPSTRSTMTTRGRRLSAA